MIRRCVPWMTARGLRSRSGCLSRPTLFSSMIAEVRWRLATKDWTSPGPSVLDLAARRSMIDFANALARLRTTNFRGREQLFDALLKRHERGSQP
jgi:hypothetical protein